MVCGVDDCWAYRRMISRVVKPCGLPVRLDASVHVLHCRCERSHESRRKPLRLSHACATGGIATAWAQASRALHGCLQSDRMTKCVRASAPPRALVRTKAGKLEPTWGTSHIFATTTAASDGKQRERLDSRHVLMPCEPRSSCSTPAQRREHYAA